MSEISPIDQSVLELLERSRLAVEEGTSDQAREMYKQAQRQDAGLSVGGLLLQECTTFKKTYKACEEFYLQDATWFQRRSIDKNRQANLLPHERTVQPAYTSFSNRQQRQIRFKLLQKGRIPFSSGSLFPQEAELTDSGPVIQDWAIAIGGLHGRTYHRVHNPEQAITHSTEVHHILLLNGNVSVREYNKEIDEQGFYFPLGLIMEANRQIRESVPRRISKKW